MARVLEHRTSGADLDDLPEIHHRDAMAHALDNRHVVRDEEVREAELRLQVEQEVDDLRLNGHVQGGDRLVGDDDSGIQCKRASDGDTLALAAREFMRIALRVIRRQADVLQEPRDALLGFAPPRDAVHVERLGDREADGEARIEGGERILEDHLDIAPQRPHFGGWQLRDVAALELDAAAGDVDEAQKGAARRRLAAARFADECKRFSGREVEAHPLDRMDPAGHATEESRLHVEACGQIADLEDWCTVIRQRCRHHRFGGAIGGQPVLLRTIGATHRTQARHGGQQSARVVLARRCEDALHITDLDLAAVAHHDNAVGDLGDDAHVVSDEDHCHVHFVLQEADERQDLRLHRHIERRRRLIGNQQVGAARQCHRDHHALPHSTGELVRVAREHLSRLRDADELEHPQRFRNRCRAILALMQPDRLADLVADGEDRVERGHRLLEDHCDLGAADVAHRRTVGAGEVEPRAVAAREINAARGDPTATMLDESHHR